jgi:hypothetical protein
VGSKIRLSQKSLRYEPREIGSTPASEYQGQWRFRPYNGNEEENEIMDIDMDEMHFNDA